MPVMDAYTYAWPRDDLGAHPAWRHEPGDLFRTRAMPESLDELRADSRWPSFFPSPLCFVTTNDGSETALEKVVGASIVNRFPYVVALSFCRQDLSTRHHRRSAFMETLERSGCVALQFLPPGPELARTWQVILATAEDESSQRLASTNLPFRRAITNRCPVFEDAYLVYEAELARPQRDFAGNAIFEAPWVDVGSHRIYFLEINAIQLRADIAQGNSQVRWHSLPRWQPVREVKRNPQGTAVPATVPYQKGFRSDYAFPSANTVAFEANGIEGGRAFKLLPRVAQEQVELDNDRARWPCFFPSSVGMITCQADGGDVNLMPCGSTTVLSRQPMVIAPAVSYAAINQRYAPRASLELIRKAGRFGCGVPMANQQVLNGICYAGNVSFAADSRKVTNAGFTIDRAAPTPRLAELPVHYDCELTGEIRLGTHFLFLGEVRRISVRADVTPGNPICWIPWANVEPVPAKECA